MSDNSMASKLLRSSFWQYLGSWIDKLIGFVSTLILARILLPDDFGVVAAASIITGFFHVIASVGTDLYLIRKNKVTRTDLNTGWTINVIMKFLSAISIFLLAGTIADFMGDDRLVQVLQIISLSSFLSGFNNIGMVLYEKEYKYRPRFIVRLSSRIIGFLIKVALALYLNNYWAFIIAELVEVSIFLIGTFIAHSFRPHFSLVNWKEQWFFSQWILLKSIFVFLRFRVDDILLSRFLLLDTLGVYTVSKELASLPAGQIIAPVMEPLYVGLSDIHDNKLLFADRVHKALSLLFIIVLPVSLGIHVTADNLVYTFLGEKWQHAVPIVMIIAFTLIPGMLGNFFTRVMTAMGCVKLVFQFEFFLGILSISMFFVLAEYMTVLDFARLNVAVTSLNTFIVVIVFTQLSSISFLRICILVVFPLISAVSMLYAVLMLNPFISIFSNLIQLIIQVSVGVLLYFYLMTSFIYLLRNKLDEYQFIWKTFYLSIISASNNR